MVATTRESRGAMLGFTALFLGVPLVLGAVVMGATNPEDDARREQYLRQRAGLDGKLLAKANKERLGVLLAEVQGKADNEQRYRQALDGKTLGTSSGSTLGRFKAHD